MSCRQRRGHEIHGHRHIPALRVRSLSAVDALLLSMESYREQPQDAELRAAQASPLPLLGASDAAMGTLCGEPLTFVKGEEHGYRLGVNL